MKLDYILILLVFNIFCKTDEKDDVQLILAKREMETSEEGKPANAPADTNNEGDTEDSGKEEDSSLQDVILAITSSHFKEKHNFTARTLYKVGFCTL